MGIGELNGVELFVFRYNLECILQGYIKTPPVF